MAEAFPESAEAGSSKPSCVMVTDEEILDLARDIPHERFLSIGQRLGFRLNELTNWKEHDHKNDIGGASRKMLMAWRDQEEGATKERLLALIRGPEKPVPSPEGFMSKRISANLTVRECQQRLVDHYTSTARIQLQPGQARKTTDFADLHTKISMHKKEWKDRGQRISKGVLVGSIDDIFETEVDGKLPPRIALLGAPGLGKTTSLAKFAHDWAVYEDSPLRHRFPLLFWLKFRELTRDCSLGEAIRSKLLQQFKGVTKEEIESFIGNNGERCCVLLDGYDEFGRTIHSPDPPTSLMDILLNRQFPDCRVLVSTRPNLASHFEADELTKIYAVMQLDEFDEEARKQYIGKYFIADPPKGRRLLEFINTQYNLISLISIPFFCMVLCTLWKGDSDRLMNVETASNMMVCFVEYLAAHAIAKKTTMGNVTNYSAKNLRRVMAAIGKVAFETLLKDRNMLIINKELFDGCQREFRVAVDLGLLHTFDKESDKPLAPNITLCEFYHKLAQEHCSGVYLATLTHHELEEKLSSINSSEMITEFEHVLRFAAESGPLSYEPFIGLVTRYNVDPSNSRRDILNTLALDIVGISASPGLDEQCHSNPSNPAVVRHDLLEPYFRDGIICVSQASKSTIAGMENLPISIKHGITYVNINNSHLRPELVQRLCSSLSEMTGLLVIELLEVTMDEESAVNLVDTCRSLGSMRDIEIWRCNIPEGGILHHHLEGLQHPGGEITAIVYFQRESGLWVEKKYTIPRVTR